MKTLSLNVGQHFMHDETGQYIGILRFVPEDTAALLFDTLRDVELLIRVNSPMNDGSDIHKAVKQALKLAAE